MASRKQGRDQRRGTERDLGPESPAGPNTDERFLEALSDSAADDFGLASGARRLRDVGSGTRDAAGGSGSTPPRSQPPGGTAAPKRERAFEVLDEPLPSERAGKEEVAPRKPETGDARSSAVTAPRRPDPSRAAPAPLRKRTPRTRKRPVRPARRLKRTIKRVNPWSVLKMSLFYYSIVLILWLLLVALVYSMIESFGVFETIRQVGDGIEVEPLADFEITLGLVERWAFYFGGAMVVVASLINVVLAVLYNLGSDIFGGIEVTFVERDDPRPGQDAK